MGAGSEPGVFTARLDAEVHEGRDRGLADRQAIDAGLRGERLDGPKTGRLGLAVIADGVLRAGVVPVSSWSAGSYVVTR